VTDHRRDKQGSGTISSKSTQTGIQESRRPRAARDLALAVVAVIVISLVGVETQAVDRLP